MARNKNVKRLSVKVESTSGKTSGCVVSKPGSPYLYFDFHRNGWRTEMSSGDTDTKDNLEDAVRVLRITLDQIESRVFCFAEAFPGASKKLKAMHALLDGHSSQRHPKDVTFGDYVGRSSEDKASWRVRILEGYPSASKITDYKQAIDDRLLPYFGSMNFLKINGVELEAFFNSLKWRKTKKIGQRLSASRVGNIRTVLDAILFNARTENRWDIDDPFEYIRKSKTKILPVRIYRPSEVFRFADWKSLLAAMDPFYSIIAEFFVMTGMIGSEMAGLRKKDIVGDYIHVRNKRVLTREDETLKNVFRVRRIPITVSMRHILDTLLARSSSDYVVMMHDGKRYSHSQFKDFAWEPAFRKERFVYTRPYTTRHTFAAWAMTLNMDLNKLERLMGHNTKEMLYEVYGKYVEGLEEDFENILQYLGEDFLRRDVKPSLLRANRSSESSGESLFVRLAGS